MFSSLTMTIMIDSGFPNTWRQEHSSFTRDSCAFAQQLCQVVKMKKRKRRKRRRKTWAMRSLGQSRALFVTVTSFILFPVWCRKLAALCDVETFPAVWEINHPITVWGNMLRQGNKSMGDPETNMTVKGEPWKQFHPSCGGVSRYFRVHGGART